jgi:hypothetical protein
MSSTVRSLVVDGPRPVEVQWTLLFWAYTLCQNFTLLFQSGLILLTGSDPRIWDHRSCLCIFCRTFSARKFQLLTMQTPIVRRILESKDNMSAHPCSLRTTCHAVNSMIWHVKDDELRKKTGRTIPTKTHSMMMRCVVNNKHRTKDIGSWQNKSEKHRYVCRCLRSRVVHVNWQELGWIKPLSRCSRPSDSSCARHHTCSSILRSPSHYFLSDLIGNVLPQTWLKDPLGV